MGKLDIRFTQSLGGVITYQANEKDKKGDFVFYKFDTLEAIRLVDSDYAIAKDEKAYDSAKSNIEKLQIEADKKKELIETIENLEQFKLELESKELEVEDLKFKISDAEKALKSK